MKSKNNVSVHPIRNIGLDLSVSHAIIQNTLTLSNENAYFVPKIRFMTLFRKNVLTVQKKLLILMDKSVRRAKQVSFIAIWANPAKLVLWAEFTTKIWKNVNVRPISFGLNILASPVCILIILTIWLKYVLHAQVIKFTTFLNKNVSIVLMKNHFSMETSVVNAVKTYSLTRLWKNV